MRKGTRRLLMAASVATALLSSASLLVLRSGRPLYYTDGEQGIIATELVDSPMLTFANPQPVAGGELPGPIRGRVQAMPDGRLVYGRVQSEFRTDLVLYDPQRPQAEPIPLSVLNTSGHELSPWLGSDGLLYFASDRPEGLGGFDLYAAPSLGGDLFGLPNALPDTVNTEADEVDPTVDPLGPNLVFVRRQPAVDDGRNGQLFVAQMDSDRPAVPLWERRNRRRGPSGPPVIDREPAYAPDGIGLWFVRQVRGRDPVLHHSWRHRDGFVDPVARVELGPGFRSPLPLEGGFRLQLLRSGNTNLIYQADAVMRYPWWEGQHPLELLLFLSLLTSLLLLLLLLLGRRWSKIDIITWCLLLSLLLHLLVWMLVQGVEILDDWVPGPGADERLAVRLVSARSASQGPTGQTLDDISSRLQFRDRDRALDPSQPEVAMADTVRQETPDGARSERELETSVEVPAALLEDASEQQDPLAGRDRLAQVRAERPEVSQDAAAEARTERSVATPSAIQATVPDAAALPSVEAPRAQRAIANERQQVAAQARATEVVTPQVQDPTVRPQSFLAGSDRLAAPQSAPVELSAAVPLQSTLSARPEVSAARPQGNQETERPQIASQSELPQSMRRTPRAQRGELAAPRSAEARTPQLSDALATDNLAMAQPSASVDAALMRPAPRAELAQATQSSARMRPNERPGRAVARADRPLPLPDTQPLRQGRRAATPVRTRDAVQPQRSSARSAPRPELADRQALATDGVAEARPDAVREELEPVAPRSLNVGGPVGVAANAQAVPRRAFRGGAQRSNLSLPSSSMRRAGRRQPRLSGLDRARPGPRQAVRSPAPDSTIRDALQSTASTEPSPATDATESTWAASQPLAVLSAPPAQRRAELPTRSWQPSAARARPSERTDLVLPGTDLPAAPRRARAPRLAAGTPQTVTPTAGLYSNRFGPAKAAALERFGGTEATERAVASGLRYLAGIQAQGGYWGSRRRGHNKYGEVYVGKSALCLLAFLGAGHTHVSDTEYSDNVERVITFLLREQDPDTGHFGATSAYGHGISTYALAECLAITGDDRLRDPVRRAVDRIVRQQSRSTDRRNRGGWGYFSPVLRPEDRYSRTSVSAWMVMALKSASLSGIEVPNEAIEGARSFLLRMFDQDYGYFLYNREPSRLRSDWRTLPASTPAAVFSLLLLGEERRIPQIRRALEYVVERSPQQYRRASDDAFVLRGEGNVYFWYYGTLACFLGGGTFWEDWNEDLRELLPASQDPDGSFAPIGSYARTYARDNAQDRSYSTAMAILCLEIYYRYFTPLLEGR